MNSQNNHSLKELIEKLISAYKWEEKLVSVDVYDCWEKVVGKVFARHTTNLHLENRILYVRLDSSVIRNELHMERSKIKELMNKELGKKVVDEIVLR